MGNYINITFTLEKEPETFSDEKKFNGGIQFIKDEKYSNEMETSIKVRNYLLHNFNIHLNYDLIHPYYAIFSYEDLLF